MRQSCLCDNMPQTGKLIRPLIGGYVKLTQ